MNHAGAVAISYKRAPLYFFCLMLGAIATLCMALIVFLFSVLSPNDIQIAWILSLILVAVLALVAGVTVPPILRYADSTPAIVVSAEGLRTRDMSGIMSWDEIDKLTTSTVHAWAGRHTNTTEAFEIHPKAAGVTPGQRLRLIDGHANSLKVPWHALAEPERLTLAVRRFAPEPILARSDHLSGFPGSQHLG